MRTPIASLASIILAFAATASASTITFFDGTFTPGTWTGSKVASTGVTSYSFNFTQILAGGDPGAWEQDQ